MAMWIDTNECEDRFHEIRRNNERQWVAIHRTGEVCDCCEFNISDIVEND